ncbi:TorF family putative porin [Alishewanella sp. HL-SH06]|uniref:TorF family putative porin n=1 Tax=Alishewanella sp. HL-SH06 TaxID=3461144 RepID=UPI0040422109
MTLLKKLSVATYSTLFVAMSAASMQSHAVEVSGDVTFVSDYAFRGISQTDEAAALQGALTLSDESGIYLSVWGSSVDFGGTGTLELDVMLGWSGDIAEGWSADVGIMRYGYPNTEFEGSNFWELYGSVAYKDFSLGLAYSDDYYGNSGNYYYVYAGYSLALTDNLAVDFHVGQNEYSDDSSLSYLDYGVTVSTEVLGLGLSLAYIDTDVKDLYLADSRVVFGVSKSF